MIGDYHAKKRLHKRKTQAVVHTAEGGMRELSEAKRANFFN